MIQNLNCAAVYGGQLVHVKLPRHAHVEDVKRAIFTQLNCEQGADIALFLARDSCGTWLTEEHPEYQQLKYGNHVIPHRIETMTSNYMCDDTSLSTIPFPKRGRGYIDVLFEVSGYGPIQPRYKTEDKHCGPASCAVFLCAGLATAAIIPHLPFVAAVIADNGRGDGGRPDPLRSAFS
ncbi:hypothetical protein PHYSODRAFT_341664 [Phytophthora sojae]|uniref:Uncharacterized protein n=1 Tax=Phytophthora sojae (strain P6497) TaxID=1094619 RepID=G5AE01_PHYSP|nr:hypothetical protein PHYSODRAFT_341664 [Phytophthora sojae]EGZ06403.1 hypothetical protein PHYSODRAFT_341664 [Phytophthora sojae]|eukprot:XP_009538300.1 hypothetical protein PHYSODRAFT_341664 [Phytophthora sojae]